MLFDITYAARLTSGAPCKNDCLFNFFDEKASFSLRCTYESNDETTIERAHENSTKRSGDGWFSSL